MKRLLLFLALLVPATSQTFVSSMCCEREDSDARLSTALTAGYVFKHDCKFKKIYGKGMANIITADFCYYPWKCWGFGTKLSYWQAHGCTAVLKQRTQLYEVPFTFYVRGRHDFDCGTQLYASLGGGALWIREKSYLGKVHATKAIGEFELGVNYPLWRCVNITGAYRYLFPHQTVRGKKVTTGGSDLRAGFAFLF